MLLGIAYCFFSVLGMLKRKSKLLSFILLGMMWITYGLATYNGDFGNYNWIYINILNPGYWIEFEPLFTAAMYICRAAGLSFIQFRMVLATIFILLLHILINKFTKNEAEVLGLYMIFPFAYFSSVMRSGFAALFISFAYYEVMGHNRNPWKFWFYMVIATLIHRTSILFCLYFLVWKSRFDNRFTLTAILVAIAMYVAYYTGLIYKIVSLVTDSRRTLQWFIPETAGAQQKFKWAMYLFAICGIIVVLSYYGRHTIRRDSLNYWENRKLLIDMQNINLSIFLFSPAFFINNNSARLMWQMLLLNIICFARIDESQLRPTSLRKWSFSRREFVMLVLLILFFLYTNLPYRGTINDGLRVFEFNLLTNGEV